MTHWYLSQFKLDYYLHYLFDDSIIDYIVNCKFYYCIPLSIFN